MLLWRWKPLSILPSPSKRTIIRRAQPFIEKTCPSLWKTYGTFAGEVSINLFSQTGIASFFSNIRLRLVIYPVGASTVFKSTPRVGCPVCLLRRRPCLLDLLTRWSAILGRNRHNVCGDQEVLILWHLFGDTHKCRQNGLMVACSHF